MTGFFRTFAFIATCMILGMIAFWAVNRGGERKVAAPPAAVEPSAPAAVVSMEHFFALNDGMSYADIVKVIGAEGRLYTAVGQPADDSSAKQAVYMWTNPDGSKLSVVLEHDALVSKEQLRLK